MRRRGFFGCGSGSGMDSVCRHGCMMRGIAVMLHREGGPPPPSHFVHRHPGSRAGATFPGARLIAIQEVSRLEGPRIGQGTAPFAHASPQLIAARLLIEHTASRTESAFDMTTRYDSWGGRALGCSGSSAPAVTRG